jgi:hypothetical protein
MQQQELNRSSSASASVDTGSFRSLTLTLTEAGLPPMPCLRCGADLDLADDGTNYVACGCGAWYHRDTLVGQQRPGYWRQWVNALSCTCTVKTQGPDTEWRIDHYADAHTVLVTDHQCQRGGVGTLSDS